MLAHLAEWLNSPAFTLAATTLSTGETLGFVTGASCVWLAARANIWNFPLGIANCLLLLFIFLEARLFADSALQVMFILLNVRGWWFWASGSQESPRSVAMATTRQLQLSLLASAGLSALLGCLLWYARGSIPVFDGTITGLSVVAQWLLNRKLLQNWLWWIAVDLISIPVYFYKQLYLISLLYVLFLGICVVGYRTWRRDLTMSPAASPTALAA